MEVPCCVLKGHFSLTFNYSVSVAWSQSCLTAVFHLIEWSQTARPTLVQRQFLAISHVLTFLYLLLRTICFARGSAVIFWLMKHLFWFEMLSRWRSLRSVVGFHRSCLQCTRKLRFNVFREMFVVVWWTFHTCLCIITYMEWLHCKTFCHPHVFFDIVILLYAKRGTISWN